MTEDGRYEGEVNGKGEPHGNGTYYYDNGDQYDGEWKDGKAHGHGVMESSDGQYQGQWKDDVPHGQGKYTLANGDVYEGTFEKGRTGEGVYESTQGWRYEGQVDGFKPHGEGTIYLSDGKRLIGQFDQKDFVKGEIWYDEEKGPVGKDVPFTIEPIKGNYELNYRDGIMRLLPRDEFHLVSIRI